MLINLLKLFRRNAKARFMVFGVGRIMVAPTKEGSVVMPSVILSDTGVVHDIGHVLDYDKIYTLKDGDIVLSFPGPNGEAKKNAVFDALTLK